MVEWHYGKYIPDHGLAPAIIEALERQNRNRSGRGIDEESHESTQTRLISDVAPTVLLASRTSRP